MEDHIEVIVNCAKKFPELRFGQFLVNALQMQLDHHDTPLVGTNRFFYMYDRDMAEHCKSYCKEQGR